MEYKELIKELKIIKNTVFYNLLSKFLFEKIFYFSINLIKFIRLMTRWTGSALGCCLTIFLNGDHIDKAYEVIKKLDSEQHKIINYPTFVLLSLTFANRFN